MNEESATSAEMEEYYRQSRRPLIPRPTGPLGRLGCGAALVIWFAILLLPFAMFWLGSGRTITIPQGNIPDAKDHPHLELRLIMDADNRGLQIKRGGVAERSDEQLCIEESVIYLLWQSEGNTDNALYCQCYERQSAEAQWALTGTTNGTCEESTE